MADGSWIMAMDRDSVRMSDRDGRLHVAVSHISKANVCPYFGREIPDNRALGLDPDKVYYLLRDPAEMAKPETVASANNLPLLSEHVPVTARTYDGHKPELVVGSTGTDAAWNDPYMDNSMVFWAKGAIEGIQNKTKKELSVAYYYRADMTPGVFKGVRYDGVMRDIFFNHLCQVTDGRAGDDVVVMDSALVQQPQGSWTTAATDSKEKTMTKTVLTRKAALVQGAIHAFLAPKLALDAQIDYAGILKGIGPKNYKAKKAGIVTAIKKATEGKLAQDADIADFHTLLDSLDDATVTEATEAAPAEDDLLSAGEPIDGDEPAGGQDDDPVARVISLLTDKVPADVLGEIKSILQPPAAADEEEENPERPTENDGGANPGTGAADEEDEEMKVTPAAMDAAIKTAVANVRKDQAALRDAEAFVRPWVGELVAMDSAEAVLRSAAKALHIDGADTIHASALKTVISMQPKPGARPAGRQPQVAMDAASAKSYAERFPGADHIRSL